jgi:hypothetical protein
MAGFFRGSCRSSMLVLSQVWDMVELWGSETDRNCLWEFPASVSRSRLPPVVFDCVCARAIVTPLLVQYKTCIA